MKKIAMAFLFISSVFISNAQDMTVEKIIESYVENTGGREAWMSLKSLKMEAKIEFSGMELPLSITSTKSGEAATVVNFQGMTFYQGMFDGETLWGTNQMTMKAEKGESEDTENIKRTKGEFPEALLTYKDLGYTVELEGEDTKEGVECYKIKMTKKAQLVDGKEKENVVYYYLDKENFVPIMQEQEMLAGQMKGQISQTLFSDYQEVDGLYFAFSMTQQLEGQDGQEIVIESVELNPEIDKTLFVFPSE